MAVVGSATVVVRAVTTGFGDQIKRGIKSAASAAEVGGEDIGRSFTKGVRKGSNNPFGSIVDGLRRFDARAQESRRKLVAITQLFNFLGTALTSIVGGLAAAVSSLATLGAAAAAALPSIAALGSTFITVGLASRAFGFGMKGISGAVSQATASTSALGQSVADVREEIQQLTFDSEEAALSQKRAALNLEDARANLQRVQDLPPNSRARREAQLAFEEAELGYRRAKDRAADLQEQVEKGISPAGAAGSNPYAGLTESQESFARFIVDLQPRIDALREQVAGNFLPEVQVLLENLVSLLEGELNPAFETFTEAIGDAIINFNNSLVDGDNIQDLGQFLTDSAPRLEQLGTFLGNIFGSLLSILTASGPLTDRFTDWLEDSSGRLDNFLQSAEDDGSLQAFFDRSGDYAARFGEIFGNIFTGIGKFIDIVTQPGGAGDRLITQFQEITGRFANLGEGEGEADRINDFFNNSLDNANSFFGLLGDILGIFGDIGADPRLGETFENIREGIPSLEGILEALLAAGPAFGEFVAEVLGILDAFTTPEGLTSFFEVLRDGATAVREFVEQPGVEDFIQRLAPIAGALIGINFLFNQAKFFGQAAFGTLSILLAPLSNFLATFLGARSGAQTGRGGLSGVVANMQGLAKEPGKLAKAFRGAGIAGIVIFIVSKIVEFYNKFEDFRETVDNTLAGVGEAFGGFFESIGGLFETLFGGQGLGGIIEALDPILKFLLEMIIPAVGLAISNLLNGLTVIIDFISSIIGSIFDSFGLVIEGVLNLFSGDFKGGMIKILGGAAIMLLGIIQGIVNGAISVINYFIGAINNLMTAIGNSPVGDFLRTISGGTIDVRNLQLGRLELVDWTGEARASLQQKINASNSQTSVPTSGVPNPSRLADGGVVPAMRGGMMAIIGEGGRPERVEPLDPDGLSNRDRAIISELAGNGPTINVYPSPGMDEKELAEMVSRKIAFDIRRGAI